jgi:uncharacterized caspase-like protein
MGMTTNRPLLRTLALAIALSLTLLMADAAHAQKRVALVIGNSAYINAPALPNPVNDAKAIAAKFKDSGYEVRSFFNVDNIAFKRALREFEVTDADITVVYYAGHAIEISGTNYVIPIDAKLASTKDVPDEAIPLDRLIDTVEGAKKLSLVILDASRDNPFIAMRRARTSVLSVNAGSSPVDPSAPRTLIAYASRSGTTAEDGAGEHSPYTEALLQNLFTEGLDIRLAFGRVRDEVLKKTGNRQEPFVTGSIGGEPIALVPGPGHADVAARVRDEEGVRSDYLLVEKIGTELAWQIFLKQHPQGMYSELARVQIEKLTALKPQPPATPNPTTEEQQAWDRIKDLGDTALLQDFIKRYPASPLATAAQTNLDVLTQKTVYEKIRHVGDRRAWEVLLIMYPNGPYAEEARRQIQYLGESRDIVHDFGLAKQAGSRVALEAFISDYKSGPEVEEAQRLLSWLEQDGKIRDLMSRGRSYALIVGNKAYRDFDTLQTPHEDARSIADVLTTQYGFTTELTLSDGSHKSLVLLDRPGREFRALLDDLEEEMNGDDRLLIFYAGHGLWDERTGKAYWIPVDAQRNRRHEWISADDIISALKGIKARSVLVVADSCFSGALLRTAPDREPSEAELASSLVKDAQRASRILLASGGTEPVLDGGARGHSIFARKFLDALTTPIRPIFSAHELYLRRIKPTVSGNARQVPQYDAMRESGHDAGDFVFMQVAPSIAPAQAAAPK